MRHTFIGEVWCAHSGFRSGRVDWQGRQVGNSTGRSGRDLLAGGSLAIRFRYHGRVPRIPWDFGAASTRGPGEPMVSTLPFAPVVLAPPNRRSRVAGTTVGADPIDVSGLVQLWVTPPWLGRSQEGDAQCRGLCPGARRHEPARPQPPIRSDLVRQFFEPGPFSDHGRRLHSVDWTRQMGVDFCLVVA